MKTILKPSIKAYLLIAFNLITGFIFLISSGILKMPVSSFIVLLVLFILLNTGYVIFLKLKNDFFIFYNLRKIHFLLIGFLAGTILVVISPLLAFLLNPENTIHLKLYDLSLTGFMITFCIIAWEELWFRGLFLNYCNKHISKIKLSLIMGTLFLMMHLLNPQIVILKSGPSLFFAGALLTLLYLYYRTIWLPLGVHLGNNYVGKLFDYNDKNDLLFGGEGYIPAIILAAAYILFCFLDNKKRPLNLQE